MVMVSVGDRVMAPRRQADATTRMRLARVLLVMPELAIVEYEDKLRHCLPRQHLRAPPAWLLEEEPPCR